MNFKSKEIKVKLTQYEYDELKRFLSGANVVTVINIKGFDIKVKVNYKKEGDEKYQGFDSNITDKTASSEYVIQDSTEEIKIGELRLGVSLVESKDSHGLDGIITDITEDIIETTNEYLPFKTDSIKRKLLFKDKVTKSINKVRV